MQDEVAVVPAAYNWTVPHPGALSGFRQPIPGSNVGVGWVCGHSYFQTVSVQQSLVARVNLAQQIVRLKSVANWLEEIVMATMPVTLEMDSLRRYFKFNMKKHSSKKYFIKCIQNP